MTIEEAPPPVRASAAALDALQAALRRVQDCVIGTMATDEIATESAAALERVADSLSPFSLVAQPAGEWGDQERIVGTRTFSPECEYSECSHDHETITITFPPFYTGANGVVHGGAIAAMFDEGLGRLANRNRTRGRTAYLHVEYRAVSRVGRPLRLEVRLERIERRKRFVTGRLMDGDTVTAEGHGLWISLLPGQP